MLTATQPAVQEFQEEETALEMTAEELAQEEAEEMERQRQARLIPCPGCCNGTIDPQEPLPTDEEGWSALLLRNGGTHALFCEWVGGMQS